MTTLAPEEPVSNRQGSRAAVVANNIAFGLLLLVLLVTPFPLGSAVAWGIGFVGLLVALTLFAWAFTAPFSLPSIGENLRLVWLPALLVLAVLIWAFVQTLPIVPADWVHPVWAMASDALHRPTQSIISMNAWRTRSQIFQLGSYAIAFWLALSFARQSDFARRMVDAVIVIASLYAVYAFALALFGVTQDFLMYGFPRPHALISGPFMLHNSFATYMGLATIAAALRLHAMGGETIVSKRGPRQLVLTTAQFAFGRGAPILIATLLLFSAVIASASRAGFIATIVALIISSLIYGLPKTRSPARTWTTVGVAIAVVPLLLLLLSSADTLGQRLAMLADVGTADDIRLALWDATTRMIASAPWRGLGLGTFQDAYPLYAVKVFPYVMDKAHCDYLEFAAGVGLPAAIAWWAALLWLAFLCLRGAINRRRNRIYPLLGFGASVLVAVHSSVDFSLQIPAVGLLYAVLLGIGVAQSQRTRRP